PVQLDLGKIPESSKLASREELAEKNALLEAELVRVLRELYRLRNLKSTDDQLRLLMQEQLESLRAAEYGASSERDKKPVEKKKESSPDPKPRVRRPSERHPQIPVREELVAQDPVPSCPCCSQPMLDSGLTEDSE